MHSPVSSIEGWTFRAGELPKGVLDGFWRQAGIQPGEGVAEALRQHHFTVAIPLPLGERQGEGVASRRYIRTVLDPIAETFQPSRAASSTTDSVMRELFMRLFDLLSN